MNKTINVILGPTSTGKTSLSLALCKKHNGVIISGDSRQIYKHMDIGTGKVPLKVLTGNLPVEKMSSAVGGSSFARDARKIIKNDKKWTIDGIDIWGYDLADPDEYFSAFDFATFGRQKILELQALNKQIFIVGGTGFYIDLLAGDMHIENIGMNSELRKDLESKSLDELVATLTSLNLQVADKIDKKNKYRLIRAIERETLKNLATENTQNPLPQISVETALTYWGLTASREWLYGKSDEWLEIIWQNGLLTETEALLKNYPQSTKMQGLIYKSVVAYLNGELPQKEAMQRAKFDLHAYIRRQQTWFKKNKKIRWFDIEQSSSTEIQRNIENLLQ